MTSGRRNPPSTGSATPVMKALSGPQSCSMAATISSTLARRRIGMAPSTRSSAASGPPRIWASSSFTMAVSAKEGQIAFTRMLRRAYSTAAVLVSPTTPCLAAA